MRLLRRTTLSNTQSDCRGVRPKKSDPRAVREHPGGAPAAIDSISSKLDQGLLEGTALPPGLRLQTPAAHSLLEPAGIVRTLPLLYALANEERTARTDLGSRIVVLVPHLLEDLYGFLWACERIGAGPGNLFLAYKPYPYKHKEEILKGLAGRGYKTFPLTEIEDLTRRAVSQGKIENKRILIVEDGGYFVPLFHKRFPDEIAIVAGAVEQTTKGIRRDEDTQREIGRLSFPVISVAESTLKREIEPPHVAEAAVRNMRTVLSDLSFSGKPATVIGYGAVGKEIALRLRDADRMVVSVHDRDPNRLVAARNDGFDTDEHLTNLLRKTWLVVGATGNMAIDEAAFLALAHGAILVSVSSDQEEIGIQRLAQISSPPRDVGVYLKEYIIIGQDKKVLLIGDGFPVNFVAFEGIPNEVIDIVLAQLFLGMISLLREGDTLLPEIHRTIIDGVSEERSIPQRYHAIHRR